MENNTIKRHALEDLYFALVEVLGAPENQCISTTFTLSPYKMSKSNDQYTWALEVSELDPDPDSKDSYKTMTYIL